MRILPLVLLTCLAAAPLAAQNGIDEPDPFGVVGEKNGDAADAKEKTPAQQTVVTADQKGDRATLKADSYIPATMAAIYLLLMLYFKAIGGYKTVRMDEQTA